MLVFAVVVVVLAHRAPMWLTLVAASVAWLVVSLAGYLSLRLTGGRYESQRYEGSWR
jgi:hypothetical protein